MPFSTTGSVVSTDLDNMVRGLYRDNSDATLTGTVAETTLKSVSIAANTIGATGGFHVLVWGSGTTGVAGTKTFRLYFGSQLVTTIADNAGTTADWSFDAWCFNTATGAQRWFVYSRTVNASTVTFSYITTIQDTTQNQILKVTGQLGSAADTVVAKAMDVFIVQIT